MVYDVGVPSLLLMLGYHFPAQGPTALYWLNTIMAWYSPHLQTYSFVIGVEKSTLVLINFKFNTLYIEIYISGLFAVL